MSFVYSDLNAISPTSKPILTDIESVYQSLYNILNTRKGERLFEPEFGISLEDYLFELDDDLTESALMQDLGIAIMNYEARVTIDYRNSSITKVQNDHKFILELIFNIAGLEGQSFSLRGTLA